MSAIVEKILLHLSESIDFGCSYKFKKNIMLLKSFPKELNRTDEKEFRSGIRKLYKLKFIIKNKNNDGFVTILITEKGKLRALNFQLENLKNKKTKWDGKWRMVSYDIPEKYKGGRNALRQKLKNIGFKELQKSILIFPYDCKKEIGLLVELFKLKSYVRFGVLESVDNEDDFKKLFKLN